MCSQLEYIDHFFKSNSTKNGKRGPSDVAIGVFLETLLRIKHGNLNCSMYNPCLYTNNNESWFNNLPLRNIHIQTTLLYRNILTDHEPLSRYWVQLDIVRTKLLLFSSTLLARTNIV